jgi:hypothetical protein
VSFETRFFFAPVVRWFGVESVQQMDGANPQRGDNDYADTRDRA